jgi:uncharacterized membrane protein
MKSKIVSIFSAVLIFFTVVLLNAYLLFWLSYLFPSLLTSDLKLQVNHLAISQYILWDNSLDINSVLDSDQAKHISDVRELVKKVPLFSLGFVVALLLLKKTFKLNLRTAVKYSIFVTAIFIFTSIFFFMPFFIKFHELLFPQGNWQFPSDSVLIMLYPENLWLNATIALFTLTIIELLLTHSIVKRKVTNT